ncbi:MAG: hypothetical protein JZU47_21950 [Prolixibacteraceae bacterium]|nr:hypothetical protein [Prolixibacteraceae bacterium]
MNKLKFYLLVISAFASLLTIAQNPVKLRRADCFFGVHFDLHASEDITDAGRTLTPQMVDTFLTKVRPDFIQIDCKGHPGISSYPTKAGYHVKGFQKDPLKLWREVTEKNKVGLYMHYSGVWDGKAATEHPDWAMVKASGEKSVQKMSFFSPYLDQILIPQLKELSGDYHVDGAWIDGDCWAVETDYSDAAIRGWKQKTGFSDVPRKKDDINYQQYLEYTRSLFREYMGKYIDAIHEFDPNFQITSNWSYSSLMPEKVENKVDFLSGDVTPQNGVFRSAFEARCLAPQGKPWDLMAWGFSWNGEKMPMSNKSVIQLKQEAAEIIAMGGGVQFYFQQNRDLSLKPWLANTLSELGTFCRARQAYCHKANAIPQIALLFPTLSYQHTSSSPYTSPPGKFQATLYALLDNQLPVEVLMEHHLTGKMNQYPLIVIPECNYIEPSLLTELRTYVQNGGNLLVIGTETSGIFARELGIQSANTSEEKVAFISAANRLGSIRSPLFEVKLGPESKAISNFYDGSDYVDKSKTIASSVRKFGKGKIAAIYFNAGSSYSQFKTPVIRDFIAETIAQLSPEKLVEVSGSHLVHVAVNKLNNKTYINLINVAGEHTNQSAVGYDQVPALTDISVTLKSKPSKIILQPEGKELNITFANGKSTILIPKLEIHSILEVIE